MCQDAYTERQRHALLLVIKAARRDLLDREHYLRRLEFEMLSGFNQEPMNSRLQNGDTLHR